MGAYKEMITEALTENSITNEQDQSCTESGDGLNLLTLIPCGFPSPAAGPLRGRRAPCAGP